MATEGLVGLSQVHDVDAECISRQIAETESSIARLEKRKSVRDVDPVSPSAGATEETSQDAVRSNRVYSNPSERLEQLKGLDLRLQCLSLAEEYATWEESARNNDEPQDPRTGVEHCSRLSQILLHFPPADIATAEIVQLHQIIQDRYRAFHSATRAKLRQRIRHAVNASKYPSEDGCATLRALLSASEEGSDGNGNGDFVRCCANLVKLQVINESFLFRSGSNPDNGCWQRIDLVDELCRPIVTRVRYHFLSNNEKEHDVDGTLEGVAPGSTSISDRYDRLVEWLLTYLREQMTMPLELIPQCVDPLFHQILQDGHDGVPSPVDLNLIQYQPAQLPLPAAPSVFFVREMVLLARHVLIGGAANRTGKTNVLSTILSDDNLFCRAMENILRFDEYVLSDALGMAVDEPSEDETLSNVQKYFMNTSSRGFEMPRLSGIVTANPARFRRWMEMEHDSASETLQATFKEEEEEEAGLSGLHIPTEDIARPALSPSTEMLISLLCSYHAKCKVAFLPTKYQDVSSMHTLVKFINGVHIPLAMSYLDSVHGRAKAHIKQIISVMNRQLRPLTGRTWSSSASTAEKHADLTAELHCLVESWCRMIAGTLTVGTVLQRQAQYWDRIEGIVNAQRGSAGGLEPAEKGHVQGAAHVLDRMSSSIHRLFSAMMDEFTSAVAECIVVDDVSVASYLMRVHYFLQGDDNDGLFSGQGDSDGGIKTGMTSSGEGGVTSVSSELCDCIHVLSVIIGTLTKMHNAHNRTGPDASIGYVTRSLSERLTQILATKFIEVALEPPVLGSEAGMRQFNVDMNAFAEVFTPVSSLVISDVRVSFNRLVELVNMMILDKSEAVSLRDVLRALVGSTPRVCSGQMLDSTDDTEQPDFMQLDFEVDDRVIEEARTMLLTRGFTSVDLRDALTVLNRRQL